MFSHLVPKPEPAYHSGHEPAETRRAITKLNYVYFVCVCVCERERERELDAMWHIWKFSRC